MNVKVSGLVLSTWLLSAGLAAAQGTNPFGAKGARVGQGDQTRKMYEDIEIFRRLLRSKLQRLYAPVKPQLGEWFNYSSGGMAGMQGGMAGMQGMGGMAGMQGGMGGIRAAGIGGGGGISGFGGFGGFGGLTGEWASGSIGVGGFGGTGGFAGYYPASSSVDLEGVYLKGQGVVYTVTLPPLPQVPKVKPLRPAPKALTDWELYRKELRGEKAETPAKNPSPKSPSLSEIILKALADNGHHFTQLGDNQTLTVVVTFRSRPGHGPSQTSSIDPRGNGSQTSGEAEDPSGFRGRKASSGSTARDYELLGDLLVKQSKTDEAVKAYRKALDQKPEAKQEVAIWRKLAQVYLTLGQDDAAQKAVESARKAGKKGAAGGTQKPAPARSSPLPAKLIISASKKLLNQAGTSKITFDEFKKAATVEYLNFASTGK
jgi:tetratricopeptide (TPR) repeat protein